MKKIIISLLMMCLSFVSAQFSFENSIVLFFHQSITGTMFFIGMLQFGDAMNTIMNNFLYANRIEDACFIKFFPANDPNPGHKFLGRLPNGMVVFPHNNYTIKEGVWLCKMHSIKSNYAIAVPIRKENAYEALCSKIK